LSVRTIACPECKYALMYATLGTKGSYKTGPAFEQQCTHAGELEVLDAMSCPVLRAAAEGALRAQFPGREVSR
jgi:hypothetical protein